MLVPFIIVMLGLLCVVLASFASATLTDTPFDQIISHQAVYPESATSPAQAVLPFNAPVTDVLYDANGYCFTALTEDGIMWASRHRGAPGSQLKPPGPLENPYSDWTKVSDFSAFMGVDGALAYTKRPDSIVVATGSELVEIVMDFTCSSIVSQKLRTSGRNYSWGDVTAFTSDGSGLWLGSSFGLMYVDTTATASPEEEGLWSIQLVPDVPSNTSIPALLWAEPWAIMFVSTTDVLYELRFLTGASASSVLHHEYVVRQEWVEGILDYTIRDMTYDADADCLWAVELDSVHKRLRDGSWWRAGYYQGASTDNLTAVAIEGFTTAANGYIWIGTADKGLMRMMKTVTEEDGEWWVDGARRKAGDWQSWQLFYGPAHTPDGAVRLLVSDAENCRGSGNLLVVTESGVTVLTTSKWTLAEKAEIMQSFQYPRHDRHGIVAEVQLQNVGDLTSYSYNTEDSDSIWTGQYAVAASMRYAVTRNEGDRKSAWHTFEALELLGNITGIPGLVGRSMCSPQERRGEGKHPTNGCGDPMDETSKWHESDTMSGWVWKGDTSSDTVNGHYFAYGLVLDQVAVTDDEKRRAIDAIDRLTSYIVENDLYYIDITGEATQWGRWNPADLNGNSQYVSERGVNSLEIMGFLALAYSVTEKQMYYDTFQDLAQNHGYYENILNQKIDNPYDDNHSDNELGFMGYHTLFYAHQRLRMSANADSVMLQRLEDMVAPVIPSIRRWYSIVRNERNPLWLAGVAGAAGVSMTGAEIQRSVESLQMYRADFINWAVRNTGRWDCVLQPYYSRDDPTKLQMSRVLPPQVCLDFLHCSLLLLIMMCFQERMVGHYNGNPFIMDASYESTTAYDAGGGNSEYSPAEWLLPYWMLRFYGLLD